jgi:hypothetical protein
VEADLKPGQDGVSFLKSKWQRAVRWRTNKSVGLWWLEDGTIVLLWIEENLPYLGVIKNSGNVV